MKFFKSKNCKDCPIAEKNLKDAIRATKLNEDVEIYDISTTEGRIEALNNMVMSSPTLLIRNKVLTKEVLLDIKKLIDELKNGN